MPRILVGLSGGVDSTVAAFLLQQDGWDVEGVTMLLWNGTRQGSSCSTGDHTAAQAAADHLGIPLHIVDWTHQFTERVTLPHQAAARRGETDNPCINCNLAFKLDGLLDLADQAGITHIASGHYARTNGHTLQRAADPAKDQSYVLATATTHHLSRYVFPLGELTKAEVRRIAADHHIPAAHTRDSMGLCLNRSDLLEPTPLQLLNTHGEPVGLQPRGELLTVGQRRGVHTGGGSKRQYIIAVQPHQGTAIVGTLDDLLTTHQATTAWTPTNATTPTHFQNSAHGTPTRGTLNSTGITWDTPQRSTAPGQLIVGYHHDTVVGYTTATHHQPR